jgi:adenylate cyclase
LAITYASLGFYLVWARQYDEAIDKVKRAFELEPNSADVLHAYAAVLTTIGKSEESIPFFKEALRLNPKPPLSYISFFAVAFRDSGHYEEAIVQAKRATEQEHDSLISWVVLTSSLSLAGRNEEARTAAKEILRISPGFSVEQYQKRMPHKDRSVVKRFCGALRAAGLPN